ncbi:pilus (MSHA type) biogenesis protein MshL [Pseudomonas sp. 2FG]|uniref:pilus (MSHA type) biogenesis protein MshL n=1 Tax=Pseudomonas sp. 2FG TaxID=2502191 RepID=UPI002114459E|nr:pilus (MSHA type) biogenesis protein MshL [Pseudomonas sp. 2FG]
MPMTSFMSSFGRPSLGLLSLVCLLSACQTFQDGDQQLYEQSGKLLDESLQQAQGKVAPPPSVQAALMPPLSGGSSLDSGPRFDVAAKDMPAREFFLSLMEGAGQNLVVHPDVGGSITFSLRRVTLEEVLAAVRDSYGYDFRRSSYGYQILPNRAITRSYNLNYLNLQRLGQSDTRVSSGQVVSTDSTESSGSNSYGNSGSSSDRSVTTLNASQVTTSSNVDFWREVREVVAMIVGGEQGNSVVVNPQASLLVVRANSADQENVARFLAQAQRNLQRQVILETKILEVQLSDGFQSGISWEQLGGDVSTSLDGEALSGPTGIGGVFSSVLSFGDFTALIQLLETQGEVRVLSSPRVSTLNNQKAVIKVGTDEFFVTEVSSTSSTTTVAGVTEPTQDITLTPFFSGISLDVTPQIDENETVTLHVRPTVSRVRDQNKLIVLGEDNVFNLPLALSTTRQSDSIVRARSGQVVVIGGLLQNTNENTDAEIPWASTLPIVGNLFKQQRKALQKSELVILMRPQVVSDEVWLDELRKSAETFKELR